MKRVFLIMTLLVAVFMFPQAGHADGFWLGFGMSSGYGYGGGYYGGGCGYVPVAPVVPVVPYYGGGCSTTTIIHDYSCGYRPYHYHYRPHYRNWFDSPYCGNRVYYGGAYHPYPPAPRYGHYHPRRRPRVHINNCNNCTLYGKGYRRRP